jgi:hypothetical protein
MSLTVEAAKQMVAEKWGFSDLKQLRVAKNGYYHWDGVNDVMALLEGECKHLSAELEKHRWIPEIPARTTIKND